MYTSHQRLLGAARSKGYNRSTFTSWDREIAANTVTKPIKTDEKEVANKKPVQTPPRKAVAVTVPVSTGIFATQYRWNKTTNNYTRIMAGSPHADREKGAIKPNVVLALQVQHDAIRDSNGYSYPNANTSGKSWVFQNGVVQEIRWSKSSDKAQIILKDTAGKPVTLVAGQTWIAALRQNATPTWQ